MAAGEGTGWERCRCGHVQLAHGHRTGTCLASVTSGQRSDGKTSSRPCKCQEFEAVAELRPVVRLECPPDGRLRFVCECGRGPMARGPMQLHLQGSAHGLTLEEVAAACTMAEQAREVAC